MFQRFTGAALAAVIVMTLGSCGIQEVKAPPHGRLSVSGGKILSQSGAPVQLRGMSTMGLQWYGGIVNAKAFDALAQDWESDVIRLALYVGEGGYADRPELKELVKKGIDLAISRGLYVIVDWHVLTPGDPDDPVYAGAQDFFLEIAGEYGAYPHLIYEIMNEPNGQLSWAEDLKPYAQRMVNAIRSKDPHNLILIGSGTWSQDVDTAALDPVDGDNLAYTVHFYAGTHGDALRAKVDRALAAGAAVFCSEWGTSEASGNGGPYLKEAGEWLDFFDARDIGWVNWSLCNKNETSAAFKGLIQVFQEGAGQKVVQEETPLEPDEVKEDGRPWWPPEQLTPGGNWVRARLKGIPVPEIRAALDLAEVSPPADPGIFRSLPWDFEDGTLQGWTVTDDSPVKVGLKIQQAGTSALSFRFGWSVPGPDDPWNAAPRITSSFVDIPAEGYSRLKFDFLLDGAAAAGARGQLEVQPVIQSPQHGYWFQMDSVKIPLGPGRKPGEIRDGLEAYTFTLPLTSGGKLLSPEAVMRNLIFITIGLDTEYHGLIVYDNLDFLQ